MRWIFDSGPSAFFACSNMRMCARWNRSNTPSQYLTKRNTRRDGGEQLLLLVRGEAARLRCCVCGVVWYTR